MRVPLEPRPLALGSLYGTAGLTAVAAVVGTLLHGFDDRGTALAFGALIAVGELARGARTADRAPAPLATAGALGYAVLGAAAARATYQDVPQVIAVVVVAGLLGRLPHIAAGRCARPDDLARRVLTVTFAAVCVRLPGLVAPEDRLPALAPPEDRLTQAAQGPARLLLIVAVLMLTVLGDALLTAGTAGACTGRPFRPLWRDAVRAASGIGCAVVAGGAVMSLGMAVAGRWALPLCAVPLVLAQLASRRHAAVRAASRQAVAALARATEIAGCTPPGHALRVAELSRAVGGRLGLSGHDLNVLECAALMHDTGQLALPDPLPAGATTALTAVERRRIARLGGAVVRGTGVPPAVADIVERQAEPYREQPLAARIVRAANAYDELARAAGPTGERAALERLRRAAGSDYQPEVVAALAGVLARERGGSGRTPPVRTVPRRAPSTRSYRPSDRF